MVDVERPNVQRPHYADRLGVCQACQLIWPCPDLRRTLQALFPAEDDPIDEQR